MNYIQRGYEQRTSESVQRVLRSTKGNPCEEWIDQLSMRKNGRTKIEFELRNSRQLDRVLVRKQELVLSIDLQMFLCIYLWLAVSFTPQIYNMTPPFVKSFGKKNSIKNKLFIFWRV